MVNWCANRSTRYSLLYCGCAVSLPLNDGVFPASCGWPIECVCGYWGSREASLDRFSRTDLSIGGNGVAAGRPSPVSCKDKAPLTLKIRNNHRVNACLPLPTLVGGANERARFHLQDPARKRATSSLQRIASVKCLEASRVAKEIAFKIEKRVEKGQLGCATCRLRWTNNSRSSTSPELPLK